MNKNLVRHVNTVYGNEPRKDNDARKEGLLKLPDSRLFEDPSVGSVHQVAFKSPAYNVSLAMKAHEERKLA